MHAEIRRRVSEATFDREQKRFGGMGVAEWRRLKQLEEEHRRVKPHVADLRLAQKMLQDVLGKRL